MNSLMSPVDPRAACDALCQERRRQHRVPGHREQLLQPGAGAGVGVPCRTSLVGTFLRGFSSPLASFSRLIFLDREGTDLSDAVADLSTLEQRMDDVRAVMDAAGSERAAVLSISEGGP